MDLLFDLGYGEKGNWHLAGYVLWGMGLSGFRYVWNMCFFFEEIVGLQGFTLGFSSQ